MARKSEIRKYLNVIRRAVSLIEAELDRDDGTLEELMEISNESKVNSLKSISLDEKKQETKIAPEVFVVEKDPNREKHIQDLINIESWPESVANFLVGQTTDKDQKARANAVLDTMISHTLDGLNFLDFGCGEGWIAQEAKKRGANYVCGYDLVASPKWNLMSGVNFTQSKNDLKKEFYDVVFLYDVLDHCFETEEVMQAIMQSLKPDGTVYVRCHPWTSKTAMHLHKNGINKAYFHMFLTWEEIKDLIKENPTFTRKEKDPIEAYRWWFKDFKVVKERIIRDPVNDFFKNEDFKNLIASEQSITNINDFVENKMQIQFVEYILKKK